MFFFWMNKLIYKRPTHYNTLQQTAGTKLPQQQHSHPSKAKAPALKSVKNKPPHGRHVQLPKTSTSAEFLQNLLATPSSAELLQKN